MPRQNPLFVRIDEPLFLKRSIIESAIDSVILLKDYERLKLSEKQIADVSSRFILLIRDIESKIDALVSIMPQVRMPGQPGYSGYDAYSGGDSAGSRMAVEEEPKSQALSSLEDELKDIEEKLKSI